MIEDRLDKIEKDLELMNTEILSLIIYADVNALVVEALDDIGVRIYKLYNEIKKINEI